MRENAPDGRLVHHWRGTDRKTDIEALADAIVAAVPDLFVGREGGIVQHDKGGGSNPINWQRYRALIDQHVCGVRLVPNGGAGWQKEYFTYAFDPPPGPDWKHGGRRPSPNREEPDNAVLDQIYRELLAPRLPRAVE
jgi:hypothetical protein